MRRLWLRLRCFLGAHRWFYQTIGDPEEVECRRCSVCGIWQARGRLGGGVWGPRRWGSWEPYEPTREPWGPVA
jgi:hypothetical protein